MNTFLFKAKTMKYCKPDKLNSIPEDYKLPDNIKFWNVENFQGYYFLNDNILYIYFNGSNDVQDWLDNFNTIRTKVTINNIYCGKIHTGFMNYYENIQETFLQLIRNNIQVSEIHITGYSLGGSCVIAALYASFIDNCPPITVVTFGSPRIGNKKFTKLFKKRIHKSIRVVNDNDPVTKVPLPIRFTHVQNLNFLHKNKTYKNFWKRLIFNISHFFDKSAFFECHSIDNYIDKLSQSPYHHGY